MTPQEIEKAAEAWADNPEHRHKHKIWMRPSHIDAYKSGANLVMERVRVLEAVLLKYMDHAFCECGMENCQECSNDCMMRVEARAALEGK